MFGLSSPIHWLVIGIVLMLVFGNRLPGVMRSLGQGVVEFKKGLNGIEDDVKNTDASAKKIEEEPAQK
jgi:sec-independent protein translocase protein TatA